MGQIGRKVVDFESEALTLKIVALSVISYVYTVICGMEILQDPIGPNLSFLKFLQSNFL